MFFKQPNYDFTLYNSSLLSYKENCICNSSCSCDGTCYYAQNKLHTSTIRIIAYIHVEMLK